MRNLKNCFRLTVVFGLTGSAAPQPVAGQPGQELKLTAPVYDYAGLGRATFQLAARDTRRIFIDAGVNLELVFCPVSAADIGKEFSCLPDPAKLRVTLKILPETMARRLVRAPDEMGRSMVTTAYVFLDRIEDFAKGDRKLRNQLLGHVFAHELGHLILGHGTHSKAGIMKPLWVGDMSQLRQGSLLFHPAEVKRIRSWAMEQSGLGTQQPGSSRPIN